MTAPSTITSNGNGNGNGNDINVLYIRRLGINTHQEPIVYIRADCHVCRSEGFDAHSRVRLTVDDKHIVATVNVVTQEFLSHREVGLSESAWSLLGAEEGATARLQHAKPAESMSYVRGKLYGQPLTDESTHAIIQDITSGIYTDIQLAAFVTACAGNRLDSDEVTALTRAMVGAGQRLDWGVERVMDKHCVGGLPGNRTTPLVVAIVTAAGLIMPKTSSRAITSPAGTADTMETLAPVELSMAQMRDVVAREGGCIAWGGSVSLSPADDILIRVERALDLDSEGQLVASVLSKKIAAGSTDVLLDLPVGLTAKVRTQAYGDALATQLRLTGEALGLRVQCLFSDGSQPVGNGIGPALEARDLLLVFQGAPEAPADLRERALDLAGHLLEMGNRAAAGEGRHLAESLLDSGAAWRKFQAICAAQGGLREPPRARYQHPVLATRAGTLAYVNNRLIAKLAKLAGAPGAPAAGLDFHVRLGQRILPGMPLFTLHAESRGELNYALDFMHQYGIGLRVEEDNL